MIDLSKVELHQLLIYKDTLATIVDKYEKLSLPLYGKASEFIHLTPEEVKNRGHLTKAQGYLGRILDAIEEKVIDELENKPIETNKTTGTKTNGLTAVKSTKSIKNNATRNKKKVN